MIARILTFLLDKSEVGPDNECGYYPFVVFGYMSWRIRTMPSIQKRPDSGKVVRSDSRGRIPLGPRATDKDFRIEYGEDGAISLIPVVFVPEREAWLYENESAIAQVRAGLADASEGRVREVGSFAEYADTEIE